MVEVRNVLRNMKKNKSVVFTVIPWREKSEEARRKVFPSDSDAVAQFCCLGLCCVRLRMKTSARVWRVELKPQLWLFHSSQFNPCYRSVLELWGFYCWEVLKIHEECLKYNLRTFSTFTFQLKSVTQYTRHELAPRMYELICLHVIIPSFSICLYFGHIYGSLVTA